MRLIGGLVCLCLGGFMTIYFFMFFDPSVKSDFGTGRINNLGLMQDKQNGLTIGLVLTVVGVLILLLKKTSPPKPVTPPPLPPQLPTGFGFNVYYALQYRADPNYQSPRPIMSEPMWLRELAKHFHPATLSQAQVEWGFINGVEPQQMQTFITYIEEFRQWQTISRFASQQTFWNWFMAS